MKILFFKKERNDGRSFKALALSFLWMSASFPLQASDQDLGSPHQMPQLNSSQMKNLEDQVAFLQREKKPQGYVFPEEIIAHSGFFEKDEGQVKERKSGSDELVKKSLGLSIDGGGMRGLMPAKWLESLEDELLYEHKVPLYRVFDYMGGTSIGGIISLGLAHGIPAKDLANLFEDAGQRQKIFPKSQSSWKIVEGMHNTMSGTMNWYTNRYNSSPLEELLKEKFGHATLEQLKTNVLVTACTIEGIPFLFENDTKSKYGASHQLWEVARCTSAAPTYFPAHKLEDGITLVDGGLWANNPSVLVAGRMIKKVSIADMDLLSLGTGVSPTSSSIPVNVGKFGAIKPLLDVLMNSHSLGNHLAMEQFLGEDHYLRVNAKLDYSMDLDATDPFSIKSLINTAKGQDYRVMNFYNSNKETIRKILEENKKEKGMF